MKTATKTILSLFGILAIALLFAGCGGKEFDFPNQDDQYPEKGIAVTSEASAESKDAHEMELRKIYNNVEFLSEDRVLLKDSSDKNPQYGRVQRFRVSGKKN